MPNLKEQLKDAYDALLAHPYRHRKEMLTYFEETAQAESYVVHLKNLVRVSALLAAETQGIARNPMIPSITDMGFFIISNTISSDRKTYLDLCLKDIEVQVKTGKLENLHSFYSGVNPMPSSILPRILTWDVSDKSGMTLRLSKDTLKDVVEYFDTHYPTGFVYWVWEELADFMQRKLSGGQ